MAKTGRPAGLFRFRAAPRSPGDGSRPRHRRAIDFGPLRRQLRPAPFAFRARPAKDGAQGIPPSGDRHVITPAFAQAAPAAGGSDILMQMLPFVLIFIIMYFLLIRPQQKRVKAHQEMIKNVRRGDTVVLNSGMIGKVTKVIDDGEAEVEIADNVRVKVVKSMIADIRNKSEPAPAN
jgi:preprotein translocase subunit YajC